MSALQARTIRTALRGAGMVLDVDGIYLTFDRTAIRNRVTEAAPTTQAEAAIEESTNESNSAIEE